MQFEDKGVRFCLKAAMFRSLLYIAFLSKAAVIINASSTDDPAKNYHEKLTPYTAGDPRSCMRENSGLEKFEVLPGIGWDNLRNEDGGNIFVYNFSLCKTTLDGRFLIPDEVETLPRKASKVNTFAELISHFTEYTSATAHSVNVHAGVSSSQGSISGSFSDSYQHAKSKQIGDKSVTTRVQLRYVRYTAKLKSTARLHPDFKARLVDIAASLGHNKSDEARFKSQLLVRDFGTHFLHAVDAGALLVQEDQISSDYVNSKDSTKTGITLGASVSFFNKFNFGVSYSTSSSKSQIEKYEKQRSSSEILTYGGPKFKASNFTANDWADMVDENMVAVDRQGDPLQYLITHDNIPDLPAVQVRRLYNSVKDAIELYYKFNTYRGCTKLDSPNFSPAANVDDGCEPAVSSSMFGGVYQTCKLDPRSNNGDICSDYNMNQMNPQTGGYSCPEGYQSVQLHTAILSTPKPNPSCYICDYQLCCYDEQYDKYRYSSATYSHHWCAAIGRVSPYSGFLFGGMYTSQVNNPLTQSSSCPLNFYPLQLGTDLKVCISDDYEFGNRYAIPFGGLFSCESGNPLALKTFNNTHNETSPITLRHSNQLPSNWPRRCPVGFSQHLAYVDQGCEINYCVKTGSLSSTGLPRIRRPPFMEPPDVDSAVKYMTWDPETKQWKRAEDRADGKDVPGRDNTSVSGYLSAGSVVGISIGTMFVGCVATVAITALVRRKGRSTKEDNESLITQQREYGSTESTA